MLTHEAIGQRLRHIREDGNSDHWKHYKGHAKNCLVSQWAALGYSGISCNCDHATSSLSPEKSTLAAVDVILRDHTTVEGSLDDVHLFKLWIVDEIDLGRFVGSHSAGLSDLKYKSRFISQISKIACKPPKSVFWNGLMTVFEKSE